MCCTGAVQVTVQVTGVQVTGVQVTGVQVTVHVLYR